MQNNFLKKMDLDDVSTALGLAGNSQSDALKQIFLTSRCGNLPIYTDCSVNSVVTSEDNWDAILDTYGEVTGLMVSSEAKWIGDGIEILNAAVYLDASSFQVKFSTFEKNKAGYTCVEKTGMWVETQVLSIHCFYCKGADVEKYLENKRPKKQRVTKDEQRVQAVKQFLTGKGNEHKLDRNCKDFYQQAYEAIGSPTQHELLKIMRAINDDLFKGGLQNFYRTQKIFTFKMGARPKSNC